MLLRSLSAASHNLASKPRFAVLSFFLAIFVSALFQSVPDVSVQPLGIPGSGQSSNGVNRSGGSRNDVAACSTQSCEWNLHTDDLRRIERRYHELPRDSCSFCLMKAAGSGRVNDEARVTSSPSLVDTFTQYKVVRTPWSFLPLR